MNFTVTMKTINHKNKWDVTRMLEENIVKQKPHFYKDGVAKIHKKQPIFMGYITALLTRA